MTQDEQTRCYFENRIQGMQDYSEWPEFADHVRALLDMENAEAAAEAHAKITKEHGAHSSLGEPRRLRAGDVAQILKAYEAR